MKYRENVLMNPAMQSSKQTHWFQRWSTKLPGCLPLNTAHWRVNGNREMTSPLRICVRHCSIIGHSSIAWLASEFKIQSMIIGVNVYPSGQKSHGSDRRTELCSRIQSFYFEKILFFEKELLNSARKV